MGRTKKRYRDWQKEMRERGKRQEDYSIYKRQNIRPGRFAAYYCPKTGVYKEAEDGR